MLKYLILIYGSLQEADDAFHAEAIYDALTKNHPHIIRRLDIDAVLELDTTLEQVMLITAEADTPSQVVVLGVGERGLQALQQLEGIKRRSPGIMIAASVHEYSDLIRGLQQKRLLDLISIPEAELDSYKNRTIIHRVPSVVLHPGLLAQCASIVAEAIIESHHEHGRSMGS